MTKLLRYLFLLFLLSLNHFSLAADATRESAQHRLPPVIYSLDIPKFVSPNTSYNFEWSVMGYHDTYDVIINIYSSSGETLKSTVVSPYDTTEGQYSWDNVRSTKFLYSTNFNLSFSGTQELKVRFFAKPTNDLIENETFLSCIVPGGLGYVAGDTSGRVIKIIGMEN